LLRAETLRQLMDGGVKTVDGQFIRYDFGGTIGTDRFFGHGGGAPGMNGELRIFPTLDEVVIALANVDPQPATRLVEYYQLRMPLQ